MKNAKKSAKTIKKVSHIPKTSTSVLGDEITSAIATKIFSTNPAPEVEQRIKSKLMQRVSNNQNIFLFASQSKWKEISPGIKVRLLHEENHSKSFMLEMAANTNIPEHIHQQDEESFVIKGNVTIEGILCHEGDYHYAHSGTSHKIISTTQGCTLLVRNI